MANIRIDVQYTITDGSEVSFTAPCDCTAITGLKVYHLGGSKGFTFKDAHGNDLTGIGNLFASGAIVKAILDVTNGHAYLQNADTNAYLETHFNNKNNPHGVTAEQSGAVPAAYYGGDTLTWDGNTEGVTDDMVLADVFAWVSDVVVNANDIPEEGIVVDCAAAGGTFQIPKNNMWITEDGLITSDALCVVPHDNYDATEAMGEPLVIPKKGTYMLGSVGPISVTIPGYTGFVGRKSIAPDYMPTAEQVGARPDTWLPTPEEIGAVATSAVGTNKVFNKLTDIGLKIFPTKMQFVAVSMPANSTLILDSRDIIAGGVHEISDLGATWAGMYVFMRGNSTARLSLLHVYGATGATTSYLNYGCYAATSDSVVWLRASNTAKVKLWENAKITSTFNAQTISLDLSGYDGVEILYYVDSTTNIYQNTGFIKNGLPGIMYYVTASTGNRLHRNFTINTNGIKFETAVASSGATVGGLCIPYQIYGIKGVG